jgi:hypothetical protein
MSCTTLQSELSELRQQRTEQEDAIAMMEGHAGPGLQMAIDQLARINADISSTQAALDLCLAQEAQAENPVPQQILGTVDSIWCEDASKEAGKDEPYVLIASFNMANSVLLGMVGLTLPDVNVVKVGPWDGVGANERHFASHLTTFNRPPFWNLNGDAATIADPQDVIFLVAFMEHDGSNPDGIRGAVRTELLAALGPNVNRGYSAYVTNMVSNMTATIESSRLLVTKITTNFDDLIGDVQQLSLTANDLATLNGLEPVTKTLRFTQRKPNDTTVQNDYTVTFTFTL